MISYILLYVAIAQPPAFQGQYDSLQACQAAITQIFTNRMNPAKNKALDPAVAVAVQYQKEYICQPQGHTP